MDESGGTRVGGRVGVVAELGPVDERASGDDGKKGWGCGGEDKRGRVSAVKGTARRGFL